MVASIGKIASPAQGVSYFERDGYYAKDDPEHKAASGWAGKGAEELNLSGPVDPATFKAVLEGKVPDGPQLGKRDKAGNIHHRPGRDVTLSAPKSVSLAALVGGDDRVVTAHDTAVKRTLGWIEKNAIETRLQDRATGSMVRAGGQKMVAATFRHDTSRNLDPQLHTHCVISNMVRGGDGKWRTMVNDGLYHNKMAMGAVYRAELAHGLGRLGYRIEKTHADGRFEIAGVPRRVIEAFSTRRTEIEAAMRERELGTPGDNPYLAARAALMTRAAKRDVDKVPLARAWSRQAAELGFSAEGIAGHPKGREATPQRASVQADLFAGPGYVAAETAAWAVEHLSERQAVFPHADLLAAALGRDPGAVSVEAAERAIEHMEAEGGLHAAKGLSEGRGWTTDVAIARESETIALMRGGQGAERTVMRRWIAETKLHRGRLTEGQKEAAKAILATKDRVIGIQGYAGTGKTTMLDRVRSLAESRDYRVMGLAPSASAARTLGEESGIESQTLQRFLVRHAGIAEGRGSAKGLRNLRSSFRKTLLVVDEASLASTAQMRDLLRIATTLRVPRVVLVGDEKQLDGVEAGKPFAQLKQAGMQTIVMDEIVRQRDADLKEAVRSSLRGEIGTAFEKLGDRVSEVEREALGVDVAMRWLELRDSERERTGVIAPTRALRDEINAVIRGRLIEEGAIHGPARDSEKLVSRGMTNAEMAVRSNYAPGDTVIFNRPYKTLGVEKGDERTVSKVDHKEGTVRLADTKGRTADWRPYLLAGAKGGVEVYRSEGMELRAGDRIRWTRNDPGSGLVNGQIAEVESVEKNGVRFRLDDGKTLKLAEGDSQLRHMDHGWASTVHAFQGRTVDNIIAAMESSHPHLTTRKAFYVAISRARDGAELVTDDAKRLADHLEKSTGDRISALDAAKKYVTRGIEIGEEKTLEPGKVREREGREAGDPVRQAEREADRSNEPARQTGPEIVPEPKQKSVDMDLGM